MVSFDGMFGLKRSFDLLSLGHVVFRYVIEVFVFKLSFEVVKAEFLDIFGLETEDFSCQVT